MFLSLAEDNCEGLMEKKRFSPTHQKYQAPSTKCFFAGSAFSDVVVVLVNFTSAWGLCIRWNLGPEQCQFLNGKDRGQGREKADKRNKDLKKKSNWLRDRHSSIWLSNISKYIFLGPLPSFHIIILTNLLFGHLRMKTNVSETMAVAIIFFKLWDYFRPTK